MKLTYPAIFTHFDDEDGYTVEFPDLPGCVTEGYGIADTMFMAEDAASGWILTELEDGKILQRHQIFILFTHQRTAFLVW